MSDSNLNLYKVFCVVAESNTYKEASEKLFITEPTICSHISNLENKLGITLFFREKKGLVLTPEGQELYNSIHSRIKELDSIENLMIQNHDISKAKIRIGCPSHLAIFYLTKCITKAKEYYPEMKFDVIGAATYKDLIKMLSEHSVDFIILDVVPNNIQNYIKTKSLKQINNIFISKEQIKINDIKELENYKYILNYENSTSTKKLFETLEKYDVKIQADIQADITEMRIAEVKQNRGIGYVMKEAVEDELTRKELYEVDLPIKLPKSEIHLLYLEKYLTKPDKIFIKKYLN